MSFSNSTGRFSESSGSTTTTVSVPLDESRHERLKGPQMLNDDSSLHMPFRDNADLHSH